MKTNILYIGLLLISPVINVQVSFATPDLKNIDHMISAPVSIEFTEASLDLEKWMTELDAFSLHVPAFTENETEIEDWMTREFSALLAIPDSYKQDISIEEWMTRTFEVENQSDSFDIELEIEPWMTQIMLYNK